MRLSVLHIVLPAATGGGLERVVVALAAGHRARGHHIAVLVVLAQPSTGTAGSDGPPRFVAQLKAVGAAVTEQPVGARGYRAERAAVAAACASIRPDVVHTHGYRPDVVDAGVARRAGVPTVTTVHGFTSAGWRNRLYERLQVRAFRRFDAVVAVSRPLGDRLHAAGVSRDRLFIIPNAYRPTAPLLDRPAARRALALPAEPFLVGWVGRLSREKGADVLVSAVVGDPSFSAVIVGEGPERSALVAAATAGGAGDRCRWLGAVPDMAPLLTAFDVFVLSSRTEGTPIVLLEAMAAGVPIVATTVGGVPDVISAREALLVAPEDPRALALAIAQVRDDPAAAQTRVAAARARLAVGFAPDPWLDQYEAVYRSLQHHGR